MRYVAAALLSALGGSPISEAGIKNILDSVGIEYDAEKAKKVNDFSLMKECSSSATFRCLLSMMSKI